MRDLARKESNSRHHQQWAHHRMYIKCISSVDSPTLNERFRNPFSHRSLESTQVLAKI